MVSEAGEDGLVIVTQTCRFPRRIAGQVRRACGLPYAVVSTAAGVVYRFAETFEDLEQALVTEFGRRAAWSI
jgi:hypothetical protein